MHNLLLKVNNLTVSFNYNHNHVIAVNNCSFEVNKGETLALVGESGSGKTLAALGILGLQPENATRSGVIELCGQDIAKLTEDEMQQVRGSRISMIFQEPMTALNPLHTIKQQICEVLAVHSSLTAEQRIDHTVELLRRVGIKKPVLRMESYPHQLSGGQRQRAMIAMALACNPQILIADEPTTALDVTIQQQILLLLKELQSEFNMAILFISHDLQLVRNVSDKVCVMKTGCIVEQGVTDEVFSTPKHQYTKNLLDAEPKGNPLTTTANSPTILSVKNLFVNFPIKHGFFKKTVDNICAVTDASMSINQGETLGLVGESGSGKTTLALAILKLQKYTGSVVFNDKEISKLSENNFRPFRREMQIVFQDPFGSLSPRMTVKQIIREGLEIQSLIIKDKWDEKIIKALQDVGLSTDYLHRYPHEFSGGQRQRIAIARVLVLRPKFIVLDEPTSALDRTVQAQIIDLLRKLQKKYCLSYLFISHDLSVVRALSHRILVMKGGEIVEQGETNNIFSNPKHEYTKNLIKAAFG